MRSGSLSGADDQASGGRGAPVPKYGRVKVNKVLQQCRISPSKTIGGLSQRQRTELVSMLRR